MAHLQKSDGRQHTVAMKLKQTLRSDNCKATLGGGGTEDPQDAPAGRMEPSLRASA